MKTLVFLPSFEASISLCGCSQDADEVFRVITNAISHGADDFPIVQFPDLRVASCQGCPFSVFFRVLEKSEVWLLWAVQTNLAKKAAA